MPTGANRMAESSGSGGSASAPPALAAPSSSASCCASGDRVMTWTRAPRASATCAVMWAERAEPVDPEASPLGEVGALQGAVADDPGAQQGCDLFVAELLGQRVGVGLVDHGVRRVAPVEVPAREARVEAQVLAPRQAEPADAAGVAEPGHADAVTFAASACSRPRAARRCRRPRARGSPDGRRGARSPSARWRSVRHTPHDADAHQHLARTGLRDRLVDPHQRATVDGAGPVDGPCLHERRHRRQRRTRSVGRDRQTANGPSTRRAGRERRARLDA